MVQSVHVKLNPGLPWQKQHTTGRRFFFTSKLDLNVRNKLAKCYLWSIAFHGADTRTLREVDQKYPESFKSGNGEGWRRVIGSSYRIKEERNIVNKIEGRIIGLITSFVGTLLKHVIERERGGGEVTGRHGRRYMQLLDDLKELRGCWKCKEEALDRIQWRTRFGKDYGPVVRQTTEGIN